MQQEFIHKRNRGLNFFIKVIACIHSFFEDRYDYYTTVRAYKKWVAGGKKTYTLEEMMKRHGQS